MLIINQAQLAHSHQVCDPAASITPQLFCGFSLFSPPPPAHLFLFLPLSQALKKTSFFVFLLTLFFFTRDLPSSSQFSWPLPIFLVWPRNFWQHACVWERNPASLVTWLEFYTNWRQSETLHLSLQQLLPWGLIAIARWQRPSSQPPEHLGAVLCALTCTFTTRFVEAVQPHFSLHGSAVDLCWLLTFIADSCAPWRNWAGFINKCYKIFHFFPYSLSRLAAHLFPLHALAGFSVSLSCPKTCTSSCTAGTGAVPGSDVLPHWPEIITDSDLRQASITVDLKHWFLRRMSTESYKLYP